jgi:hypothetical protein
MAGSSRRRPGGLKPNGLNLSDQKRHLLGEGEPGVLAAGEHSIGRRPLSDAPWSVSVWTGSDALLGDFGKKASMEGPPLPRGKKERPGADGE